MGPLVAATGGVVLGIVIAVREKALVVT